MRAPRQLTVFGLLGTLFAFSAIAGSPPLDPCPPKTLRALLPNSGDTRRGVSSQVFSEVQQSSSTQAYLRAHMQIESFPPNNHGYLALLSPEELSSLPNMPPPKSTGKPDAPHKFVFLSFNPLRELNNTYFHGHLEFADAVNNHAKKLNSEHLLSELTAASPNLRPYLAAMYNDYKSAAFAFEKPTSPAKAAQIDQRVERAVRNASFQFAAEYLQSDLSALTRGQRESIADPTRWISAGIGDTHDQAAIAARYARDLKTAQKTLSFEEIKPQITEDLKKIQTRSQKFQSSFPKKSPLFDSKTPGLLSLPLLQILRAIKSTDVDMAAGENLRATLKFSFPNLSFTDAQLDEIRRVLSLPSEDRVRARLSPWNATPEFIQSKLVTKDLKTGDFHMSPEAIAILQEERDFKAYYSAVNKVLKARFNLQLDEPLMLELRALVNQIDRFSVPVLQESRNPIAFDQSHYGFIAGDFSGLGARNLYETQAALLAADSAESAVAGSRQAFNRASAPLLELQKRFRDAVAKNTNMVVDSRAFSGDEMSVPLKTADAAPSLHAKQAILQSLTRGGTSYPASDVRLSFGLHFKEAQDLEKRLRARIQSIPELRDWATKTAFAVDVVTDAQGNSTLHLIPSQAIPRGKKALLEQEFEQSFQADDPFSRGKVIPSKESKPGARLRLDNEFQLRYPSSRPELTRLDVA